jgi:hypothetical protein
LTVGNVTNCSTKLGDTDIAAHLRILPLLEPLASEEQLRWFTRRLNWKRLKPRPESKFDWLMCSNSAQQQGECLSLWRRNGEHEFFDLCQLERLFSSRHANPSNEFYEVPGTAACQGKHPKPFKGKDFQINIAHIWSETEPGRTKLRW